jgi:hypothetical protein
MGGIRICKHVKGLAENSRKSPLKPDALCAPIAQKKEGAIAVPSVEFAIV